MDERPSPATPATLEQPPPVDPGFEAAVRELKVPRGSAWSSWVASIPLLVLAALAISLVQGGDVSARQALLAAAVLLVNKLGRALALRALGSRDARHLFVPFFNMMPGTYPTTPSKQATASLAGSAPGIALGAAVFLSPLREVPVLREVAWIALAVNAFDLLPLVFLSGGRLLDALVFQRHRALELGFAAFPALVCVGLAVALGSWVWGVNAVLLALGVPFVAGRATSAARLRGRLRGGDVAALPRDELALLYSAAVELSATRAKDQARAAALLARRRAAIMRQLHARATVRPAPALVTVAFVAAWLLTSVLAGWAIAAGVRSGSAEKHRERRTWSRVEGKLPDAVEQARIEVEAVR